MSGVVWEGGADAGCGAMGEADEGDGEVAEGGHDLGGVAGAELVVVLGEDDITDPVEGLDVPVALEPGQDLFRMGLIAGEATDQVDRFTVVHRGAGAARATPAAVDLDDQFRSGEGDPCWPRGDLDTKLVVAMGVLNSCVILFIKSVLI